VVEEVKDAERAEKLEISQRKAGRLLTTISRPAFIQTESGGPLDAKARVNAHTMVWGSVGHHEPSPRVCMSIRPDMAASRYVMDCLEVLRCVKLRSRFESLLSTTPLRDC